MKVQKMSSHQVVNISCVYGIFMFFRSVLELLFLLKLCPFVKSISLNKTCKYHLCLPLVFSAMIQNPNEKSHMLFVEGTTTMLVSFIWHNIAPTKGITGLNLGSEYGNPIYIVIY